MNTTPLVSIIIPTFNRSHLIGETLDSVLAQTYQNWECIIVDDGSTDNSEEVVGSYVKTDERFQYHHRPEDRPKGANACRNYGFEKSRGEYVNWFDDDDIMDCKKLQIQVKALLNSNHHFSVCQTIVFDRTLENIIGLRHKKIFSSNVFEDYISHKILWLTPSSLWKKSFLLLQYKLFDEELQAAQEWEFHARILYNTKLYHYTNQPLVYIRKHNESISFDGKDEFRKYNYFIARKKIRHFLKENFDQNDTIDNYLIDYYKNLIREHQFKMGLCTFIRHRIYEINSNLFYNVKLILAAFTFWLFGKGEILLKK